ncbi:sphingomyelin phosphodiesterase [Actinokineospora inagensis]|uniref:sphingomyelin phosphodiesterase n=1 Tax=Actinokineospora inagensis TaxID=103730 RepID=UPI00041E6B82|nr:sphingomyelin phosphodiesterase [Actinokineospora inagensis]
MKSFLSRTLSLAAVLTAAVIAVPTAVPAAATATTPTAPTAPAVPTTVSVLAFNIYQLPRVADGDAAGKDRRARAAETVIRSADPGVLVLEEAFSAEAESLRARLADRWPYQTPLVGQYCATSAGWTTVTGNCSTSPLVVSGGVTVFSKYPITQQHQLVYRNSYFPTADYYANKGAALVRVVKDNRPIWIAGTHLQADQSPYSIATAHTTRMAQLGELRALVAKYAPATEPVVIAGDLNIEYWAGQSRVDGQGRSQIRQAEAALSATLAETPIHPYTFDGATNPLAATNSTTTYRDVLDYIGLAVGHATPTLTPVRTLGYSAAPPSDHYPVQTTVGY